MRIVIDMQGAQTESRFRGIGRYTMAFSRAVVRHRGEHEVILALSGLFPETIEPIRAAFDGLLPQDNIRVWYVPAPVRAREPGNEWRRTAAELIREAFLAGLEPDVVHIPGLFEGFIDDAVTSIGRLDSRVPVSVTVHDLIPLLNPAHYLEPNPLYEAFYRRKLDELKRASLLLAISESSRNEALACLDIAEDRIISTAMAADGKFRPLRLTEEEVLALSRKLGVERPFVLYTGGTDERKNLPRLIRAYARLSPALRASHQLVLAGKMPDGDVEHLQAVAGSAGLAAEELRFTGYVTDDELVRLYNLCRVFVFPSWHEGFGLPALEAMCCGAPVIGANTSSLPEVIGLEAALFDPRSEGAIAGKLSQALSDEAFRASLIEHGRVRAERFSWDDSGKRAVSAFETMAGEGEKAGRGDVKCEALMGTLLTKLAQSTSQGSMPTEADLLRCARSISHNLPGESGPRQLLVDISELVQRDAGTGVQRVTRSLLREFLLHPPEGYRIEPVYATTDRPGYRYARAFTDKFLGRETHGREDEPVEAQPGDVFLGLDLQAQVVTAQRRYLEMLHRNGVRIHYMVHDLLPITLPRYFGPGTAEAHANWLRTISGFDGLICVSRTVAQEVEQWLASHGPSRMRPLRIDWSHNGAELSVHGPVQGLPDNADDMLTLLSAKPSFLMVGTIEPRKGHGQTLAAFEQLWNEGVDANLVIVGKQGWQVDALAQRLRFHPALGERLYWLEGIGDGYLERVYGACTCLIAASEGEGFGLPLIEAAQCRLPIIARDIPVFREVAGDHAYYFQGEEPEAVAGAVREWLMLHVDGAAPASDGLPWLTWRQSAQRLLELILPVDYAGQARPGLKVPKEAERPGVLQYRENSPAWEPRVDEGTAQDEGVLRCGGGTRLGNAE